MGIVSNRQDANQQYRRTKYEYDAIKLCVIRDVICEKVKYNMATKL